ncbi:PilZ domain-containing protein [Acidobacteria bacterium AH-259-G07]|nr:PilZ domain-containing protein [Acidobacteria bacterium AH-259-G07]
MDKKKNLFGAPISPIDLRRPKEARVGRKVPFSFKVIAAVESGLVSREVSKAETQDISAGGLRFESDLPLKVGDRLELKLQLSHSKEVGTSGKVVRSEQVERDGRSFNSIALQFMGLKPEEQDRIREFVSPKLTLQQPE